MHTQVSTIYAIMRFACDHDATKVNYRKFPMFLKMFSKNALQTCKSLNKLISLLISNSVEKKVLSVVRTG